MKRETVAEICVFVLLVAVGVGMRLASNSLELWNFAPVTATALFAGYYLSRRSAALAVPVLTMVLSNAAIDQSYTSVAMMVCVYGALALPVLLRGILRKRFTPLVIGGCAAGSSLSFFLISNFAYWVFFGRLQIPPQSLWHSFVAALPFYKYTLGSDLVWSAVFFGSYSLATRFGVVPSVRAGVKVRA